MAPQAAGEASLKASASAEEPTKARKSWIDEMDAILEKLERLAASAGPEYFRLSLPSIERLQDLQDLAAGLEAHLDRADLSPRTRAAILLALAEDLQPQRLSQILLDLTSTEPPSHDLLRGAFIAASMNGSATLCEGAQLRLAPLYELQERGHGEATRSFPVTLRRVPRSDHAEILLAWLETQDTSPPDPTLQDDPAAWRELAQRHATYEIGYCVWALQAPSHPFVAEVVAKDASKELNGADAFRIRAAHYSAHSILQCSGYLFDFVAAELHSGTPARLALAASIAQAAAPPGINGLQAARIEALRYSTAAAAQATLVRELGEVKSSFQKTNEEGDATSMRRTCEVLGSLATDARVGDVVRAAAIEALYASGDWPSIHASLSSVLSADPPLLVVAIALTGLADHVDARPAAREPALALLRSLRENREDSDLRGAMNDYVALLDR